VRPNALEHARPACLKTSVESRACSRLRCSCCAAGGDGLQEAVTDGFYTMVSNVPTHSVCARISTFCAAQLAATAFTELSPDHTIA